LTRRHSIIEYRPPVRRPQHQWQEASYIPYRYVLGYTGPGDAVALSAEMAVCMRVSPPAQPDTDNFNLNANRHSCRTQMKFDRRLRLKYAPIRIDIKLDQNAPDPSPTLIAHSI
jgi:hypothetical protein